MTLKFAYWTVHKERQSMRSVLNFARLSYRMIYYMIVFLSILCRLPDEIAKIKLSDLRIVTTLGVGGFGRVELCTLASDNARAFALKKMKKCQVCWFKRTVNKS